MNVCATVLISCFRGILSFEVDLFEIFKDVASQGFGGGGVLNSSQYLIKKKGGKLGRFPLSSFNNSDRKKREKKYENV